MTAFHHYPSPIGTLLLVGEQGRLRELHFANSPDNQMMAAASLQQDPSLAQVASQLDEYFRGERTSFELDLDLRGTDFQQRVWRELQKIPYGGTASYGDIATRIGNPKACRAVGMANRRNPIPIIIPCHRVIGRDGSLTGFGGGLDVKEQLLALERKA